jgi:hypothetical protein
VQEILLFWDMYEAPILIFLGLVALLLVYNAIVVRTTKANPRAGYLMSFVPSAFGQAYLVALILGAFVGVRIALYCFPLLLAIALYRPWKYMRPRSSQ